MKRRSATIFATIFTSLVAFASTSDALAQGTWAAKAPMPTARSGVGAAAINGLCTVSGAGRDSAARIDCRGLQPVDGRNGEWLTARGTAFFEQFPGKYLAVSDGEVFVADDAVEARRLAAEDHPDDEPFVQFVPRESCVQ